MGIGRYPVGVSCVHPGGIKTNIARDSRAAPDWDSPEGREKFDKVVPTTPEKAAKIILRGVQANHARILVGPDAYAFDATARILGPFYQRLTTGGARLANMFGKQVGQPKR